MKVSIGDIWVAHEAMPQITGEKWPIKTAYWLAKLAQKLAKAAQPIGQVRQQLFQEYGEDNGRNQLEVKRDGPQWAAFVAAMNELLGEETDIEVEVVTLPDGLAQVTPALLMALGPFVDVA